MKLSDGRKVTMHRTPACEERIVMDNKLSQLMGEWMVISDDLKQRPRNDPSRESKVAEVKKARAKLTAAQRRRSLHVRQHGCW
jgi:hypothetical protein